MSQRLALIGCGGIAQAHALAAAQIGAARCEIVALCDAEPTRAEDFTHLAPNAQVFTEIEALLEATRPDAVILCTPPASHAGLARAVLSRGAAVLCEKPLAIAAADARELLEMAQARGAVLRTSAKYRFAPGVLKIRECLQSGMLGQVERAQIAFGAPVSMQGRWQSDAAQSGGGVLADNGPHAVDLTRFLFGEVRLRGARLRFGALYAVEEEASLQLETAGGASLEIELSWRRTLGPTFLRISGERGTLGAGWNETWWQPRGGAAQVIAPGYDKQQAFTRQLEAFLAEIAAPDSPANVGLWQAQDGACAVEIIAAAYGMWDQRVRESS